LPSRTEPNIRPNSSAELRRLPNFGPSLVQTTHKLPEWGGLHGVKGPQMAVKGPIQV